MNMQSAPGKFFFGCFFLLHTWLLATCSSTETPQRRPELTEPPSLAPMTPNPQTFVKLIDHELALVHPHLRSHQGQIVLGQNQLQLIMANVPPLGDGDGFHPLLARIYKSTGKNWQAQSWLPQLDINIASSKGEALPLIGQDIERDQGISKIVSTFRSAGPNPVEAKLELELLSDTPIVKARLIAAKNSPLLHWQLRLAADQGEEHLIPLNQEHFVGMTLSLLPETFSILSATPLQIKTDSRHTLLTSIGNVGNGISSFTLLFGRNAALMQPALVGQLQKCLRDTSQRNSGKDSCLATTLKASDTWQVQMPTRSPPLRNSKRLFQSLYVHDAQGGFVSNVPIYEGDQLNLAMPREAGWEVLFPDEQGILKKLNFDVTSRTAVLPALALGSLQVNLKPSNPGFVEIRDAIRHESVSWAAQLAQKPSDILSAHSFLQKNWPLQLNLPAGDYEIQIFDGLQNLCLQSFTILPGKNQSILCQTEEPRPELSLRANLSLDSSNSSEELLQAAHMQAISRSIRGGRDDDSPITEIPMISAEDPNLGLSLRAFPVDDTQRKKWLLMKGKDDPMPLQALAQFARAQSPVLQLILECPEGGFQLEEYRWLALSIQPDIVEVFGCQQPDLTGDLIQVAQRLQQKSSKAIKLSTASPFPSRFVWHGLIPALYIPSASSSSASSKSEQVIAALLAGSYSLGLRSEILIPGPLPSPGLLGPQSVTVKIRSYDLQDQGAMIRVYDQLDQLTEQAIAPSRDHEQTLRINLRLRSDSRFLRFELLSQGRTAQTGQEGLTQAFLLATSNFLSLNRPP